MWYTHSNQRQAKLNQEDFLLNQNLHKKLKYDTNGPIDCFYLFEVICSKFADVFRMYLLLTLNIIFHLFL